MKIKSVTFREPFGIVPSTGHTVAKDGAAELHPAGVLLTLREGRMLVPFGNVKVIKFEDDKKP